MLGQAAEKRGFTCQRDKLLADEGLKPILPAASLVLLSPLQGISAALDRRPLVREAKPHFTQLLSAVTAFVML